MKKLISSDEAVPVSRQPTAPCSDCPFRVDALPGWLGGSSPQDFVEIALSDVPYACHALLGAQCAGLAIFRANISKIPRDRAVLRLAANKKTVFANVNGFLAYHQQRIKYTRLPLKRLGCFRPRSLK